jgi:hypothetical protein
VSSLLSVSAHRPVDVRTDLNAREHEELPVQNGHTTGLSIFNNGSNLLHTFVAPALLASNRVLTDAISFLVYVAISITASTITESGGDETPRHRPSTKATAPV